MKAHGNLSGASNLAVLDHLNRRTHGLPLQRRCAWVLCLSMGLLTTHYSRTYYLLLTAYSYYSLLTTYYLLQVGALPLDGPRRLPRGARAAATAEAAAGAAAGAGRRGPSRRLRLGPDVSRAAPAANCRGKGAASPERLRLPAASADRPLRPARSSRVPAQVVPRLRHGTILARVAMAA